MKTQQNVSVESLHSNPDTTSRQIKVIVLPSGKSVTIREYVRSWKACLKTSPDVQIKNWDWFPVSVGHVLRGIRAGIHDRINTRGNLPQYDTTSPANQKRYWDRARAKAIVNCLGIVESVSRSVTFNQGLVRHADKIRQDLHDLRWTSGERRQGLNVPILPP